VGSRASSSQHIHSIFIPYSFQEAKFALSHRSFHPIPYHSTPDDPSRQSSNLGRLVHLVIVTASKMATNVGSVVDKITNTPGNIDDILLTSPVEADSSSTSEMTGAVENAEILSRGEFEFRQLY
jgi:hypothetical protein